MIVTRFHKKIMLAYLNDDRAVELQLFTDNPYPIGTIFLGRIAQKQNNIDACFVDIENAGGFLQKNTYRCGELIPVQLLREGSGQKLPLLTDVLSISGKYAVVSETVGKIKVSSKLDKECQAMLIEKVTPLLGDLDREVILRTNSANADPMDIAKEILSSSDALDLIRKKAETRTKSVLYSPGTEWIHALRDLYMDRLDEIVSDDPAIFEMIKKTFPPDLCQKEEIALRLYDDPLLPLAKLYSLEKHLKEATQKRVWLPCGGFLVIEKTEALFSIDVNTGKTAKRADKEETFYTVNLEAAKEIARQLRLRNLSGIILIDFINMRKSGNDAKLLSEFKNELKNDPVKTEVHGFTSLGLVEMTRMKGRRSLYEQAGTLSDDETVSGDKRKI